MAKIFNGLAILSLATLLGTGGFGAYLFASGRLTAERAEAIAAILRGDALPSPSTQPTSAPAAQTTTAPSGEDSERRSRHSTDQLAAARERDVLRNLELERASDDIAAQRRLLEQSMAHLVAGQEQLEREKSTFLAQQKQQDTAVADSGFQMELQYFMNLQPKMAKEHLMRTWKKHKEDAVRLFSALEQGRGKRILEQLKSPEELDLQHELLEQLRLNGNLANADRSGKTAAEGDSP